jgi:hypothetical protein
MRWEWSDWKISLDHAATHLSRTNILSTSSSVFSPLFAQLPNDSFITSSPATTLGNGLDILELERPWHVAPSLVSSRERSYRSVDDGVGLLLRYPITGSFNPLSLLLS